MFVCIGVAGLTAKNKSVQSITVLGSTGSIGLSTLDVIQRHPERFELFALTANNNVSVLAEQCCQYSPQYAALRDADAAQALEDILLARSCKTKVLSGEQAILDLVRADEVDTVMAAIVGAAGLMPTLAAVKAGKKVLLANKEALVMAGHLFMDAVAEGGGCLLPIDSEHNAIFQCLPYSPEHESTLIDAEDKKTIRRLLLTGSGGPFRTWDKRAIEAATPEQACLHPNWSMGKKISVDSATLMNKGLEFIEACYLFGMSPDKIDVLIHPQSVVHSMVEYCDGSVLAQLGQPDMRTPIAHALAWPERIEAGVSTLDWFQLSQLSFEAPDTERFPALSLAIAAASAGPNASIVLNAANEIAVGAFLDGEIGFGDISRSLDQAMSAVPNGEPNSIEDVLHVDSYAREKAREQLKLKKPKKSIASRG